MFIVLANALGFRIPIWYVVWPFVIGFIQLIFAISYDDAKNMKAKEHMKDLDNMMDRLSEMIKFKKDNFNGYN